MNPDRDRRSVDGEITRHKYIQLNENSHTHSDYSVDRRAVEDPKCRRTNGNEM